MYERTLSHDSLASLSVKNVDVRPSRVWPRDAVEVKTVNRVTLFNLITYPA